MYCSTWSIPASFCSSHSWSQPAHGPAFRRVAVDLRNFDARRRFEIARCRTQFQRRARSRTTRGLDIGRCAWMTRGPKQGILPADDKLWQGQGTMGKLKVYGVPRSRAYRVLWMVNELGLDYEHLPVHLGDDGSREAGTGGAAAPDVLARGYARSQACG